MTHLSMHFSHKQTSRKKLIIWWVVIANLMLGLGALLFIISYRQQRELDFLEQNIKDVSFEIATFDHIVAMKNEAIQQKEALTIKQQKAQHLTELPKKHPSALLEEIAHIIPDQVFLESFILRKKIELKGYAKTLKELMHFVEKLKTSRHYKHVTLATVGDPKDSSSSHEGFISFTIEASRA